MDKWAWGRECRLAKTLITKYGKEFILWMPPPEGMKVSSLMWFFDGLGKNYLSDQMVEYSKQQSGLIPEKQEIPLSQDKIGDDVSVVHKPRTLKDFLNYGKKI